MEETVSSSVPSQTSKNTVIKVSKDVTQKIHEYCQEMEGKFATQIQQYVKELENLKRMTQTTQLLQIKIEQNAVFSNSSTNKTPENKTPKNKTPTNAQKPVFKEARIGRPERNS